MWRHYNCAVYVCRRPKGCCAHPRAKLATIVIYVSRGKGVKTATRWHSGVLLQRGRQRTVNSPCPPPPSSSEKEEEEKEEYRRLLENPKKLSEKLIFDGGDRSNRASRASDSKGKRVRHGSFFERFTGDTPYTLVHMHVS